MIDDWPATRRARQHPGLAVGEDRKLEALLPERLQARLYVGKAGAGSPQGAQRNAGPLRPCHSPDFASLYPDYAHTPIMRSLAT